MKYYDKKNKRLIFVNKEATASYWDEQWEKLAQNTKYKKTLPRLNTAIILTQKYLPKKSVILEGGCGLAMTSWYLYQLGYKPIALDYADKTIEFLKKNVPEVNPLTGDVRNLALKDCSVDGYWSFGVIEHFWEGYEDILCEAQRVIKKDGYLFVTFPQMSLMRRLKASLGLYENYSESKMMQEFYQFALEPSIVTSEIEKKGFRLEKSISLGGMKGLKDEVTFLKPILQKIYDSKMKPAVILRKFVDVALSWFFGHTHVLVLRKVNDIC